MYNRPRRRRGTRPGLGPLVYAAMLVVSMVMFFVLISVAGDFLSPVTPVANSAPLEAAGTEQKITARLPSAAASDGSTLETASAGGAETLAVAHGATDPLALLLPTVTPTVAPTSTPIASPTPEPPPTATPQPALPEHVELSGFRHMWQTWNNCGPATLAMNLSYFGSSLSQAEVGAALRKHPDDKNVNTEELAEYARQQGFAAHARVNGDGDLVRRFLSQGIPVLIETWLEPEPDNGFGHYRLLTGYDDVNRRWIAHDSYVSKNPVRTDPNAYAGIYLSYDETDRLWAVYNRAYVLVYRPDQAELVQSILGAEADPTAMWEGALRRAEQTLAAEQAQGNVTPFAWFNLGGALYHLGRAPEAAVAFDQARAIGLPWRMLWYQFEPFAAYYAVGRYQDVVDLSRATLATTHSLEEVQFWHGRGLAALGDIHGARAALIYALQLNPDLEEARRALQELEGN